MKKSTESKASLTARLAASLKRNRDLERIIEASVWSGPKMIGQCDGSYPGEKTAVWFAAGHVIITERDSMFRTLRSDIFQIEKLVENIAFYGECLYGEHNHRTAEVLRKLVDVAEKAA